MADPICGQLRPPPPFQDIPCHLLPSSTQPGNAPNRGNPFHLEIGTPICIRKIKGQAQIGYHRLQTQKRDQPKTGTTMIHFAIPHMWKQCCKTAHLETKGQISRLGTQLEHPLDLGRDIPLIWRPIPNLCKDVLHHGKNTKEPTTRVKT